MRITSRAVNMSSMQGLNKNLANIGRLQEQLSSGNQMRAASDSPTNANKALQGRGALAAAKQHARNANDGIVWLSAVDGALTSMLGETNRVRALALQARSTGASSQQARDAIAAEVVQIRQGLLATANQDVQGRPIFGGITGGKAAYDTNGAWIGQDGTPVTRRLSDTEVVRIDLTGPEAFGPPGNDLFAIADRIATDARTNPAALDQHLADLDAVMNKMLNAVADAGSRYNRVETAQQTQQNKLLEMKSNLSEVEDIDLPATMMDLQMQQVAYQAALGATAKAIQPSLIDFLR